MANRNISDLQQLSLDVYRGSVQTYSQAEGEKILRNALAEIVDFCMDDPNKFYREFKKHENEFFEIVEELITINVRRLANDSFSDWVEFKDYGLGQKPEFRVVNNELYKVSNIATGMKSLRRQKLYDRRLDTRAFKMGIKIYQEFFDFITGKINWAECVNKVSESFNYELAKLITAILFDAYKDTTGKYVVSANYSDEALTEIIRKVEGATGVKCEIYGTPSALDNIVGAGALVDADDKRNFGYVKVFKGRRCVELPQVFDEEQNKFVVDDNILIVAPAGEKIVKVGFEGNAMVFEDTDPSSREDMQVEFSFMRMVHAGVLVASKYGAFIIE